LFSFFLKELNKTALHMLSLNIQYLLEGKPNM
jgi:hypothetical protein